MRRLAAITLIAALNALATGFAPAATTADHAAEMAQSLTLFKSDIRAVLVDNCVRCHGGEKVRSGFDLTDRDGLLAGGEIGVSVIPGDAEGSPLFDYLTHREEPFMPPKKPQLPAETIALIAKWIDLGAAYDRPLVDQAAKQHGPMQVTDAERSYWAFARLQSGFPTESSIDHFISAKQREKQLTGAPPATRRMLVRRLYFDLTGLPPKPEDIDAFLADTSPDAYERLVDKLLASQHFGERWARHWLDVARFAESHGFEHDYDRKFAFHYRDFVIRAFNEDMPYDQFVSWQLAGDELAPENPLALMATGFLGAGVYPTQITISEAERIRYDAMDDMLATTGSAMLATTVACARCHDHKYDPIPTRDYYRMLSTFKTTVRSEVDLDFSLLDAEAAAAFAQKLSALEAKLASYESGQLPAALERWCTARHSDPKSLPTPDWLILKADSLQSAGGAVFQEQADGSYLASGPNPAQDVFTFTSTSPISGASAIRLEALAHESMINHGPGRAANGNIQLTGIELSCGGKSITLKNPRASFEQNSSSLAVAASIDGNPGSGWALDPQFGKDHAAIYEIANPADITAGAELQITLRFAGNTSHTIGRPRLSISSQPAAGLGFGGGADPRTLAAQQLDALMLVPDRDATQQAAMLEQFKIIDPGYQAIIAEIATLKAGRDKQVQKVMICSEGDHIKAMRHHTSSGQIPDFYKEAYFLGRGDTNQKEGIAEPGFLQVLTRQADAGDNRWDKQSADPRTSGNRAALSRWITDVDNGAGHLLARVIVNRLWQHHFGRGIVATPNDFGFQGDRPTHPELLDWLATELLRNGWHLKPIHKLILMSDTYRMGDLDSPNNQQIDPDNHFLWHRPPRRLEAEAIRDSALAVGGLLDETMYGAGTLDEKSRRRSIYFMIKRSQLVPTMQMFDWPDTLTSLGSRAVTTTPSQALIFINHPEFRQMAEGFANQISGAADPVSSAYAIAYGRPPSNQEHLAAESFIHQQHQSHQGDQPKALTDFCAAIMSANEFIYIE